MNFESFDWLRGNRGGGDGDALHAARVRVHERRLAESTAAAWAAGPKLTPVDCGGAPLDATFLEEMRRKHGPASAPAPAAAAEPAKASRRRSISDEDPHAKQHSLTSMMRANDEPKRPRADDKGRWHDDERRSRSPVRGDDGRRGDEAPRRGVSRWGSEDDDDRRAAAPSRDAPPRAPPRRGRDDDNDDEENGGRPAHGFQRASGRPEKVGAARKPFKCPKTNEPEAGKGKDRNGVAQKKPEACKDGKSEDELPEALKGCDAELVKRIESEIMDQRMSTTFDDIAGLDDAKRSITEMVIWPMQRPELFTGLRAVPRGMLLFGPPGTGKTLIGRAIASSSGATFFSISASSLMSKWIGESEKLVRTLFCVANFREPAVVFIDEVDSLLSQRSSNENEASRRIKTEFLVQLEGVSSGDGNQARLLVVGATNRPQELDEAARRRFVKRFYVPLPDDAARRQLLGILLSKNKHSIAQGDLDDDLTRRTAGFSGADIRNLCQEAAMGPMRQVGSQLFQKKEGAGEILIPPISLEHFEDALQITRASVAPSEISDYEDWNRLFGSAKIR
ncbi:P-loop containing nucleoside triphosphate hydrolase protein [Pelagophyceae sp. CCMP2097]|nr:P-loop containing nucleoside triphosphate hydrolase protein [Pelagophyceae sp. CCMP2097]